MSFDVPEYTADITGVGAARILEAIIESGIGKNPLLSGLVFGNVGRFR